MRIGNGVVSEARQVLLKKLRDKGSSGASSYTSSSLTVELSSSTSRVVSSRMEKDYGKEKGKLIRARGETATRASSEEMMGVFVPQDKVNRIVFVMEMYLSS